MRFYVGNTFDEIMIDEQLLIRQFWSAPRGDAEWPLVRRLLAFLSTQDLQPDEDDWQELCDVALDLYPFCFDGNCQQDATYRQLDDAGERWSDDAFCDKHWTAHLSWTLEGLVDPPT